MSDNAEVANLPNRIRELRTEKGLSGAALAKMTGMSQPQITRLEKGDRRLKMDQAVQIARALRVGIRDLAAEIEPAAPPAPADLVDLIPNAKPAPDYLHPTDLMRGAAEDAIPVYGSAAAGPDGMFHINQQDGPVLRVPRPPGLMHHTKVFAVLTEGTSMVPWRRPGEVVFAVPGLSLVRDCHVLVQVDAGPGHPPEAYVKQFKSRDDDEYVLLQYNPERELRLARERVRDAWRVLEWPEVFGL